MPETTTPIKPKTLTDRAVKVVNAIEQAFWETGTVPAYEAVAEKTGEKLDYVRATVERNQTARRALVARGVDLNPDESAQILTSQQLMAANIVLNTHDARSLREKLEFVGVSSQQWHAWLRQPGFSQYMTRRAEALFGANDFAAYDALRQNIEDGDMNAVKFHFEMRGKYRNQMDVNVNYQQIIVQVVEIISKHVTDKDTLLAIANDVQRIGLPSSSDELSVDVVNVSGF